MSAVLEHSEAGAPEAEIEVTPEMIEAGIAALALFEWEDKGSWIVDSIYRAMERSRMAGKSLTEGDKG